MATVRTVLQTLALAAWSAAMIPGCNAESDDSAPTNTGQTARSEPPIVDKVLLPDAVLVDDASVNDFVREALRQCAAGDYDAFRSRWTARQTPVSREEFEEGWHAVRTITVRALEKVLLADDDPEASPATASNDAGPKTAYALFVEVALDPERPAGKREPNRDIVLMLTRENDAWRIARPPKAMREWIKQRAKNVADQPSPAASHSSPDRR